MKLFPWLLTPILALLALAPGRAATLDRVLSETLKNSLGSSATLTVTPRSRFK
jgi:hypothetical protein